MVGSMSSCAAASASAISCMSSQCIAHHFLREDVSQEVLVRNLFYCVAIPRRHANDDRAALCAEIFQFALARETRTATNARRFFNAIFFCFARIVYLLATALEIDVTGRAGTNSAACMLDVDAVVDGNFEQ